MTDATVRGRNGPGEEGRHGDRRERLDAGRSGCRRNTAALTKSQRTKAAVASTIGTTIEWYDFFLYGTAAALVFPAVFFPGESALAGTLPRFAT